MFGIGFQEIIVIALIVLLLFGGKKIPELMQGLGKGVKSFKKGMKEEIVNRYNLTLNQMNSIDMNELFKTILNYFDPEKNG